MKIVSYIKRIWKDPGLMISYLTGNLRYRIYYSRFRFLIRKHIREQYLMRLRAMDQECYWNGSCKVCGCDTTPLQFSNNACDGDCYPRMMTRSEWKKFSDSNIFEDEEGQEWRLIENCGELKLYRRVGIDVEIKDNGIR